MNKNQDLYGQENLFKNAISSIDSWDTSTKNKEFVRKFITICGAENMSLIRKTRYIGFLKVICKLLKRDFDEATKEDIIGLVGKYPILIKTLF